MRGAKLVIGCLIAACGGSGGGGPTGPSGNNNNNGNNSGNNNPPPSVPLTAAVQMRFTSDMYGYAFGSFSPSEVTIARGGTVTWSNSSGAVHTVTFSTAGAPLNVASLGSGSAVRTFETTGTFHYDCANHSGMSGSVVVQ